ncbi:MAG: HDOD domain-containing protein, partial [Sterolibacteriaceae bacterium]|nr:HDOD domain-containing protein [Sterolibacteriaceae bacterium]
MTDSASPQSEIEKSLAKALAGIEIPPRPAVLDKVMAEMQSSDPDFRRLANLILADVGLAAGLIKTANSPAFGYRSKAATVRDALTMLGLINVLRTLAGLSLRAVLPESPAMKGFWETSSGTAFICGWLTRELGIREGIRSEDAYTYALFHDCGIPVLLHSLPGYEETYTATHVVDRPYTEIEIERHELSHARVGAIMAESWFLPDLHVQAILHHHATRIFPPNMPGLAAGTRRLIA